MFRITKTRLVSPIAVAFGLAIAQPAAATDYCVLPNTTCGGTQMVTFDAALAGAASSPNGDRIFLGTATYTAPSPDGYEYTNAAGPVEVIGEGVGQTVLTAGAQTNAVLTLSGGAGTTIRDLTIHLPQMPPNGIGLNTNGTAKGVALDYAVGQTAGHFGVWLHDGGSLEESSVAMALNQNTTAVYFASGGGTVRHSTLSAAHGVVSDYGGTIERSMLIANGGAITAGRNSTVVKSSVIREIGLNAAILVFPLAAEHVSLTAEGDTLLVPAGSGSHGIYGAAFDLPGESVSVSLRNSTIRGFYTPMEVDTVGVGTASITASYSDYDTSMAKAVGTNATLTQSNISNVANAGFVNFAGGDYHLLANSPLVDAGDPATVQGLDRDGNPRVTDGNLDGTARPDIGAFEVPGPLPAPADPPPAGGSDPAPTGTGNPTQAGGTEERPAGSGDAPAAATSGAHDAQPPLISAFMSSRKTFAVGRARTAISALARGTTLRYTLSEAARVTVKIQSARNGRTVGTLTRSATRGSNAIKFSGRIGRRALKQGRYRAVLTAVDPAGNRSAASRAGFRIVG